MKRQQGFTLVEIAIVLVIIGLLIGGLLKGQELIASAKVRNTISQMEELKTAVYAFQDRFKAMPGDMANANALVGAAAVNCTWACGNGLIQPWRNTSLVTNHLSAAGFYGGNTNTAETNATPTAQNAPANPFGGPMFVAYWNQYNATAGGQPSVHGVYTGGAIPSKVLAEIDRKIDDGLPQTGSFRSAWPTATTAGCVAGNAWVIDNGRGDCAGAQLF
jgi:prepilin-type N-terminal cleavage/methylation domain-containing protein